MTPEERDHLITAVLQACVDMLPSSMIELWYRLETASSVSSSEVFFTTTQGLCVTSSAHYLSDLRLAEADLVRANASDDHPFTTAVLHYRAEGGMEADFTHDRLEVMEGHRQRIDAWAQEKFQCTVTEMTYVNPRA